MVCYGNGMGLSLEGEGSSSPVGEYVAYGIAYSSVLWTKQKKLFELTTFIKVVIRFCFGLWVFLTEKELMFLK